MSGTGTPSAACLAFGPSGALYGSRGNAGDRGEGLVRIDPATGVQTAIGTATNVISDIWLDSDGMLYGSSPIGETFTINPTTGTKTLLVDTATLLEGASLRIAGLAGVPAADSEGDGWADTEDKCAAVGNPDQADRDDDGVGDACDNCPLRVNASQTDSNDNGVGDACELDSSETITVPPTPKQPGVIRPDCVNTTFLVSDGPNILPPTVREKMYRIPDDLVSIPPASSQ